MQYEQRNPLPIPTDGAFESVRATVDTILDWQYELRRQNLLALYEKGKTLTWNANDLDWSIDVDIEKMMSERGAISVFISAAGRAQGRRADPHAAAHELVHAVAVPAR